jgi:hypothetical protein
MPSESPCEMDAFKMFEQMFAGGRAAGLDTVPKN